MEIVIQIGKDQHQVIEKLRKRHKEDFNEIISHAFIDSLNAFYTHMRVEEVVSDLENSSQKDSQKLLDLVIEVNDELNEASRVTERQIEYLEGIKKMIVAGIMLLESISGSLKN